LRTASIRAGYLFFLKESSETTSAPPGGASSRRPPPRRPAFFFFAFLRAFSAAVAVSRLRFLFAGFVRRPVRLGNGVGVFDIEFQLEIHRRIIEAADRRIGNMQLFRHVGEGQADIEGVLGDFEIPELVLQHDRHLLGILLAHPVGDLHAGRVGDEGDEEMVVAGQAGLGDFRQNLADHAAQRILHQNVIADHVFSHARSGPRRDRFDPEPHP
jgi:hypothetical protein